jgi:hypothetical protein
MPTSILGFSRRIREGISGRAAIVAALSTYLLLAGYLLIYSLPERAFSEEGLIYDTIWLDAWSLAFILVNAVLWLSKLNWRAKAVIGALILGVYGYFEIGLILNGTPFSSYAYWGDQKFRQAMILKFMELGYFTDFYYHDLTPFYPPLLYLTLAGIAKLLSIPAYFMLKIGGMLIYLFGPMFLYWLWRPLIGTIRAWLVVLFTFLVCSASYPYMLSAPHAFVATGIFIPWWLRYIENIKGHSTDRLQYLIGGLLGTVIITTYYYPLFVGVFLLLLRMLLGKRAEFIRSHRGFRWGRAFGVGASTALFSSWYWGPILWSALSGDFNASIAQWHHIDSTSLGMDYTAFSWVGVLYLGGLIYSVCRCRNALHRSLLMVIGAVLPYLLVGSVIGALDHPINLIKARDMLTVFGGTFIGLMAAAWLRRRTRPKRRWIAPALAFVTLLILCDGFNGFAKSGMVKIARTAYVPTWGTDSTEMANRAGSVFLCGHETFLSFYPVYTFLAANEHYSHPVCQFKKRYDLLDLLEQVDDPRVVNIALRTNVYDKVDFFMPHREASEFDITVSLSNYPNKYFTRVFRFPETLVADSALFGQRTGEDLYEVMKPANDSSYPRFTFSPDTDTLLQLMRLAMIRDQLTSEGKVGLDSWTGVDWSRWQHPPEAEKPVVFGDCVQLKDLRIVADEDSLHLMLAFEALEKLSRRFRVLIHLFAGGAMENYDFQPTTPSETWERYQTVICRRTIPNPGKPFRLLIGLFDLEGQLPGIWRAEVTN